MDKEYRAALLGETMALSLAVNALIATHPDREVVRALIHGKLREQGRTFLLSTPMPDQAEETFSATLDFVLGLDPMPPTGGSRT